MKCLHPKRISYEPQDEYFRVELCNDLATTHDLGKPYCQRHYELVVGKMSAMRAVDGNDAPLGTCIGD